jgi:lipoprotein-anchoring transpeptidase ErfK/SrfK
MSRRRPRHLSQVVFAIVLVILAVAFILHLNKSANAIAEPSTPEAHGAPLVAVSSTRPTTLPLRATTAPTSQPALLASARAKYADGDLVTARALLNDALPTMTPADADAAKQLISSINQTLVFSPKKFAEDPFATTYTIQKGDNLAKIAAGYSVTPDFLTHINKITDAKKVRLDSHLKVLKGPFHAVVTKSTFTMDLYLGKPGDSASMYITTLPVGLGRDDSTPTGVWLCAPHEKLKNPTYFSPRGEGVIAAADPKNPLGGFWIGITGLDGRAVGAKSYGVHGTIEPDSIGKQSSLGCIRLRHDDIALVYDLLVEGKSTVTVRD